MHSRPGSLRREVTRHLSGHCPLTLLENIPTLTCSNPTYLLSGMPCFIQILLTVIRRTRKLRGDHSQVLKHPLPIGCITPPLRSHHGFCKVRLFFAALPFCLQVTVAPKSFTHPTFIFTIWISFFPLPLIKIPMFSLTPFRLGNMTIDCS